MAGQHLHTIDGGPGGGDEGCACAISEQYVHTDDTLNLDLSDPTIGKYYIVFQTGGTLVLPDIATVAYRGVEIVITFLGTGVFTITPHASDSIGSKSGVGASSTVSVIAGNALLIQVGHTAMWNAK